MGTHACAQLTPAAALKEAQTRLEAAISDATLRFARDVCHEVNELQRAGNYARAYQLTTELEILLSDSQALKAVPDVPTRYAYIAELQEKLDTFFEKQAAAERIPDPALQAMAQRLRQLSSDSSAGAKPSPDEANRIPPFIHAVSVARIDEFVRGMRAIQTSNAGNTTVEKERLKSEAIERLQRQLRQQRWTLHYEILDVTKEGRTTSEVRVSPPLEVVVSDFLQQAMAEDDRRQSTRVASGASLVEDGITYEQACTFLVRTDVCENRTLTVPKSKFVKPGNLVQIAFEPRIADREGTKVVCLSTAMYGGYEGGGPYRICGSDFKLRVVAVEEEKQEAFQRFRTSPLKSSP
jgi:hypothetical protein